MKKIDNPIHVAIVTGFGGTNMTKLAGEIDRQIGPRSFELIAGVPQERAGMRYQDILRLVKEQVLRLMERHNIDPDELLLGGFSLGGPLAALTAAGIGEDILGVPILDAPLNDEPVPPAREAHRIFQLQYDTRHELVEALNLILNSGNHPPFLSVATPYDPIVPPKSKSFKGSPTIELESATDAETFSMTARAMNVVLPKEYSGHSPHEEKARLAVQLFKRSFVDSRLSVDAA